MKTIIGLFILLLAVVFGAVFLRNYLDNKPTEKTATANINNATLKLLIAKSNKEKEVGLSEKNSLPQDYGMLFPFDKADYYFFWMKNMKFPIDIIFIRNNRIVTIHQNIRPPKSPEENLSVFKPKEPADTVLETNAGLSQKFNFKKGDEVKLEHL